MCPLLAINTNYYAHTHTVINLEVKIYVVVIEKKQTLQVLHCSI